MVALVMMPVSLSWPLFVVASFFTLFALFMVAKDGGAKRLVGALLVAVIIATPAILRAEEVIIGGGGICDRMPWLFECWCPICLWLVS
jgi:hypothetical protein